MTLRCVNCTLRVDRLTRHRLSEESEQTLERVRRWVYPRDLSTADYLCHACWELINHTEDHGQQLPAPRGHQNICITCGRSILRIRSRSLLRPDMTERERIVTNIITEWIQRQVQPTDQACIPCWLRAKRLAIRREQDQQEEMHVEEEQAGPANQMPEVAEEAGPSNPILPATEEQASPSSQIPQLDEEQAGPSQVPPNSEGQTGTPEEIRLPNIRRAAATGRRCLFSECDDREKRCIPDIIRRRILADYNFYIPINARICDYHLGNNLYHELYAAENAISIFTASHIEDMVFLLREEKQIDFTQPETIDDHLFKYWFGRTKREYNEILSQVPQLNDNKIKIGFNALLCKMRTGDSDERISALFNIPRRTLEGYMNRARDILDEQYVPRHLGVTHMSREEAVQRNTYLAEHLFGNPEEPEEDRHLIVIVDGTYLNTQKSSNYAFQKKTYSLHKYHNLVKPFLIVCCDGYIIDAFGPYAATKNDAEIMKDLIESNRLGDILQENDIFILDRGFRDCIDNLTEKGFQAHMPETIQPGERQLTTLQANITRCVTMNRWVVEAVNGRFSRDFKIFRADFLNTRCPHIMKEFRIAAALLNNFAVQFIERRNVEGILEVIEENIFLDNVLGEIVQQNNLNMRHSMFQNISNTDIVFPDLTIEDLKMIALGTYQIRQARSYVGEHVRARGLYTIEVSTDEASARILAEFNGVDPYVLRTKIKSRYVGSRSYFSYIVVDRGTQGRRAILAYYCHCPSGKRTVGCCSHVMSIMWYLGFARRQENLQAPAGFLDNILII